MAIHSQRSASMEREVQEIKRAYADSLEELKFNSRPHIMNLTELANENRERCPKVIVKLIEDRIRYADSDNVKLPTLYLMDSVLKNHGDPYKMLFVNNIIETFTSVFRVSREAERAKLYKLRQTWTPHFPSDCMFELDKTVQKIDPAWPVIKPSIANIHINPKFANKKSLESLKSVDESESDIDAELRKAEEKLAKAKKLKLEKMMKELEQLNDSTEDTPSKPSASSSDQQSATSKKVPTVSTTTKKTIIVDQKRLQEIAKRDPRKKEKIPKELVEMLDINKEPKIETLKDRKLAPVVPEAKNRSKSRSPNRQQSPTSTSSEIVAPPPPPAIREDIKKSRKRPDPDPVSGHLKPKKKRSPSPEKKSFKIPKKQKGSSPERIAEKKPSPEKDQHQKKDLRQKKVLIPEKRPSPLKEGPLIEADHPDEIIRDPAPPCRETRSGRGRGGGRFPNGGPEQRPEMDFRGPNGPRFQRGRGPRNMGDFQPDGFGPDGPRHFGPRHPNNRPSPWIQNNGPPGPPMRPPGPDFRPDMRLHGPPQGQWNGPEPHPDDFRGPNGPRARFQQGRFPPNNRPSPWLNSGPGPRPDFIPHPDMRHPGPDMVRHPGPWDRERSPFPDSSQQMHNNVPPPEHYEDISNHENENSNNASNVQPEFTKQETEQPKLEPPTTKFKIQDVSSLVESLVNRGMIPGLEVPGIATKPVEEEKPKEPEKPTETITKKEESGPKEIKWGTTLKKIEPVRLKSHDISIKTKQQGIVEQIYDPKAFQCTNCGLRYSPNEAIAYEKHKDWHFRMNKNKQAHHKRAHSRRWYLQNSDWIISHEIEDNVAELLDETNEDDKKEPVVPTVPKSSDPNLNRCAVCREDFIEEFKEDNPDNEDDDGGVYHLQNAIRPHKYTFHPQCFSDANKLNNSTISVDEEEEEVEEDQKPEINAETNEEAANDDDVEMKDITAENEVKTEIKTEPNDITAENSENSVEIKTEDNNEIKAEPMEEDSESKDVKGEETDKKDDLNITPLLTADAGVNKEFEYPVVSEIKININAQSSAPGSPSANPDLDKSATENEEIPKPEPESEFDPDAVVQEKCNEDLEDPFRHKPKLRGINLTEYPMIEKDTDFSSLCSIM